MTSPPPPAPPRAPFPGTDSLDPAQIFSGPGYQAPPVRTDGVATASLLCAAFSFIPAVGLAAAGLGVWALRRLRRAYGTGRTLARLAIVVGATASVLQLWLLVALLATRG
ncbi:hypothetical protein CHIBA101_2273 [Actinomyces sp. Chiba101]|uniref:DUF4190 domain-containing protein n=1 Tax=Actinomyces denticolens TaxID=52767 RepID=A0ABY1I977_9ACTO|nr:MULTISPECIES: imidazolonepropionase [Actinomyces]BAW94095.1 hypothetical protein CHIBA101_2273 [Actinomyces sp. Chiba101]GAV95346.1 hypothetical protein ADENT20671_2131 [Actinomyces denticolens]SHI79995.1 hypothetical protein SAMN05216246_10549 [Actinomyces denticolens]SUU13929.1 Uncharacterised protein [Actinomyces denticolens]